MEIGNPLTRITSNKIVPPKETTIAPVVTPTSGILVYSRIPKATRSVGSSSKVKIVESKTSNSKEPKQSWGSTVFDVPSSSLNDCRFGNDHIAKIMGYGDYQMGNVTISRVYYVEGLGHNLFSVGQFYDSDLEAKALATACYTQNRSLIRKHHNKTPYELLHDQKPDLSYLHVFGALCYPTNDGEDLGKLKPKADIGIFVGYAPAKKAFRIYNKRTRMIIETIHVDFDELTTMASEQFSSGPRPKLLTPRIFSS
ncbi:retrovirus-related pol polyprotein from transposon TNT 1-94 [Tanacetum coccineum]